MRFVWEDQNRAHMEEHFVTPAIAEAIFFAEDRLIVESGQGNGRYECEGSHQDRMFRLIFTALSEDEIYPITCFRIRKRRM